MAGIITSQLARSIELARRMGSSEVERTLYSDVLDKLNVGVAIVDCSGRVANASAVARKFLSDRDGLQLQGGKVRAVNSMEDRELQGAIKAASQRMPNGEAGPSRGLSLTKHSGARTLGVMIRPVSMGATSGNTGVAIYIRDCDLAPDVESEFVRQIFDLTPAEAAVTRRLTAGLSLEDAATSLDISRNTARAHLRSIFSKSGITRQTELVRLVLNSAVILGERSGHQTA
ncbi:helix-turn-helix transcriptional regulator [Pseudaminobacter salicylatoxidans]|uniref:helix-turn-helix transcriptional regulator n=1 Tax=Pseudaminobacter salicylatoxidans TaxID=93369 RepID=UPI001FCC3329|nr:helix-turn-helix transcriptional regulator [Pseudaminobacter salicylatoxidans]